MGSERRGVEGERRRGETRCGLLRSAEWRVGSIHFDCAPPPPSPPTSALSPHPHPSLRPSSPPPPPRRARQHATRARADRKRKQATPVSRAPRRDSGAPSVGRIARKCGLSGRRIRARAARARALRAAASRWGFGSARKKNEKKEKEKEKRKRECAGAPGRCECTMVSWYVCVWVGGGERRLGRRREQHGSLWARRALMRQAHVPASAGACGGGWGGCCPGVGQQRRRWLGRAPRGLAAEERALYTTARASQFY